MPRPMPLSRRATLEIAAGGAFALCFGRPALAASARDIAARSHAALDTLYRSNATARAVGRKARAVLVFPSIAKGGFIVGGESGNGALLVNGRAIAFYNISAASFGFQAGLQKFGYALFFITPSALQYLQKSKGWAIGAGPSVVIVDQGFAKTLDTTTLSKDVYAFAFDQKGLMGGIQIEGSKITPIHPDP